MVNCLLNYGYAILAARVELAIARAGLLPGAGLLHAEQSGKATLSFDLMEEFRPAVVDRTVLALVCRGRTLALDEQGLLSLDSRKLLAEAIGRRLGSLVRVSDGYQRLELVVDRQALGDGPLADGIQCGAKDRFKEKSLTLTQENTSLVISDPI